MRILGEVLIAQSDVAGKVVGVNSRFIYQDIFARNEVDITLCDSPLPYSLANTKLFRRELLERHAIRYPEDLPIGSDLPFTLEACYRADASRCWPTTTSTTPCAGSARPTSPISVAI